MKYSNAKAGFSSRLKYSLLLSLKSILLFLISCTADGHSQTEPVQLVSEELKEINVAATRLSEYLDQLEGKRVGIVANQTSLVDETHLVDTLLSIGVNVKKVFAPEHGFRGNADAGEEIADNVDAKTGLPIISLYGKNKKPYPNQLKDLDVLIFDIQDVGVRFYTYISTLHYVMEACGENDKKLIVLDRPNPNGNYVDGPVLDTNFRSFVGMHPIPIVYGMTIGEVAKMIEGEHWISTNVELEVVRLENYTHDMPYDLPVAPSPNLRTQASIWLYPSLCLFEGTVVSVGRGTDSPFEQFGHPDFPDTLYDFTPKPSYGASKPKLNNRKCFGYILSSNKLVRPTQFDLVHLKTAVKHLNGKEFIDNERFFNLLAGNDKLGAQLLDDISESEIRDSWESELTAFKKLRLKYLLYD
jgi:uncharacterized protein YbbC (DUF1343 family)